MRNSIHYGLMVLLVILFVYLFIMPVANEIAQLSKTKKGWLSQLSDSKAINNIKSDTENISIEFGEEQQGFEIQQMSLQHNVQIVSMQLRSITKNQFRLSIRLRGEGFNLLHMLFQLDEKGYVFNRINLTNVSSEAYQLLMEIDMADKFTPIVLQKYEQGIFCYQKRAVKIPKPTDFPLNLLKRLGYISSGKQRKAFVILPTQDVILVKEGDLLGKEGFQIKRIEANRFILLDPYNQKEIIN